MKNQCDHSATGKFIARAQQLFAVIAGLLVMWSCSSKPTPFTPEIIAQYVASANFAEELQPSGYIVGKAVLINIGETISLSRFSAREQKHNIPANTLSAAQEKIDPGIQALSPADVGAIVLLKWAKEALGETAAGTRYRLRCEVIIVDNYKQRIVTRRSFAGGAPAFATLYGASPEDEIVQYLNALPRQTPPTLRAAPSPS